MRARDERTNERAARAHLLSASSTKNRIAPRPRSVFTAMGRSAMIRENIATVSASRIPVSAKLNISSIARKVGSCTATSSKDRSSFSSLNCSDCSARTRTSRISCPSFCASSFRPSLMPSEEDDVAIASARARAI